MSIRRRYASEYSVDSDVSYQKTSPDSSVPAHTLLLNLDQIEPWMVDNEYILTGYRPISNSFRLCMLSVFAVHNETINIHSHFFGGLLFVMLPSYTHVALFKYYPTTSRADVVVFTIYYAGVAICFFISAGYHTVNNHSSAVAKLAVQFDHAGIVVLMWGAMIPTIYYAFFADATLRNFYWIVVTILSSACITATMHSKFKSPSMRPYRAAMYATLGLSGTSFIAHAISIYGTEVADTQLSLRWMILMAAFNLLGAIIYAARVPERIYPKHFNIYGSSHQFLHFAVVFAALAHTVGLFNAFQHFHASTKEEKYQGSFFPQ